MTIVYQLTTSGIALLVLWFMGVHNTATHEITIPVCLALTTGWYWAYFRNRRNI